MPEDELEKILADFQVRKAFESFEKISPFMLKRLIEAVYNAGVESTKVTEEKPKPRKRKKNDSA